jgi:hypothetical protein
MRNKGFLRSVTVSFGPKARLSRNADHRRSNMKTMAVATLCLLLTLKVAAQPSQRFAQRANAGLAATSQCYSTFTFGSGQTLFNFCVTGNGNVTQLTSPAGYEHIGLGLIGEGYGLCDYAAQARYFDYADFGDSGNWGSPTVSQPNGANTFPFSIVRSTADGLFTLTQAFTRNTTERIVVVKTTIKNNSPITKQLVLVRFADIDANNGHFGDYQNWFDQDSDSAWGYNSLSLVALNPVPVYGVKLITGSVLVPHQAGTFDVAAKGFAGPDPCFPSLSENDNTPVLEDGGVWLAHFVMLKKGTTATVNVEYRRF